MPSRQTLLIKRLSLDEFPVLPFLAPRVFKPWPKLLRVSRAYGTARTTAGPGRVLAIDDLAAPTTKCESMVSSARRQRTRGPCNAEVRNVRTAGFRNMSTTHAVYDGVHTDEKGFQEAYENILGSGLADRRSQEQSYVTLADVKREISTKTETAQSVVRGGERVPRSTTMAFKRPMLSHLVRFPDKGRTRRRLCRKIVFNTRRNIPRVRIKYMRLSQARRRTHNPGHTSGLEPFSFLWSYQFTRLSRKYDSQLSRYPVSGLGPIRRVLYTTSSFERTLCNSSVHDIWKAWEALSQRVRESIWIQVMLRALAREPSLAVRFLIATINSEPYPPSYAISDSLEYIVCFFLYKVKNSDIETVTTLLRTVVAILSNFDDSHLHLSQKTVFWLLSNLNVDQAEHFYETLLNRKHPLHTNTLLHFTSVFARNGRTHLATNALQEFLKNGGCLTQPEAESVCNTLLKGTNRNTSDFAMPDSDIFALLLELGLRPNIIHYNILLQNAVEVGDSETAWKIHDMLPGLGVEASAYTYSILLNDAKLRMDRPAIEQIMGIVGPKGVVDEYIVTDLLHAVFLINEQERKAAPEHVPPPTAFKKMLSLYAEHFHLEPIRGLLTQGYRDIVVQSDRPKMHPPKAAIGVMMTALLRGFTNPTATAKWYHRFRTMVLSGHPDISPLAESTYIYDAVIMSLGRWPMTLQLCTRVIHDMFSGYSAAQHAQNPPAIPIYNGRTSSTKGSYLAPAAAPPMNLHSVFNENSDSNGNQESNGLPEERHEEPLGRSADLIDEYSPGDSESADTSLTASTVAMETSEHCAKQAVLYEHCKPSVRTWSILLKAFMDHSQPRAAEKVLALMRRQGIEPNQVTWNSLAIGYARLQDIKSTVDVINRFESEGLEADAFTIASLQIIKDQDALMEALREKHQRQRTLKRHIKQQEAVDRKLSREFGSLSFAIHKGLRFGFHEESRDTWKVIDNPPRHSRHRSSRLLRRFRMSQDELDFMEKSASREEMA